MSDFSGEHVPPAPPAGFPAPPPPPPSIAPPPGYVPYGGANAGAFGNFQSIGGVAKALGILVTILVPLQLVSVLVASMARSKAQDFLEGTIDDDAFNSSLAASGLLGILSLLLTIAVAVLTMIWMNRMAKNLQQIQRVGTWTPGWAIGGWFLPPCGLYVIPFLMFRDLWKGSDSQSTHDWRANPVGPIVNIWWILYGLVLPFVTFGVSLSSFRIDRSTTETARDLDTGFGISLASGLLQVVAAVVYLLLVRQLTARHKQTINEA
jgi:ABC-type Fe3+ transport system permease subunit